MPQSFTGGTPVPHQAAYAELHCLTNFSFLRGASHPEELVARAAELGYAALAITDRNSLAGVVRAHVAAKEHGLHLIIGADITPADAPPIVLLAPNRVAYGRLARLITRGRLRCRKGACEIRLADVAELGGGSGLIGIVVPEERHADAPRHTGTEARRHGGQSHAATQPRSHAGGGRCPAAAPELAAFAPYSAYRAIFGDDCFLAAELAYDVPDDARLAQLSALSRQTGLLLVAANDVHYHLPERRYLQDVLTCIREKCTLTSAGRRLLANAERHLRPRDEIARRYAPYHELLQRTVDIARRCTFSLDELRYEYPHELVPPGVTAHEYLTQLTWAGARERYGRRHEGTEARRHEGRSHGATQPRSHEGSTASGITPLPPREGVGGGVPAASSASSSPPCLRASVPSCLPPSVQRQLDAELALIAELKYEHYFLTVWDLVRFARVRGILCQGRGSAANSAVCYCLGVTAVDPARIDLLFERFISRERNEPPDIDIDFEHERREEVFQYIYDKYGRERAAITAEVISYRPRSAVRDVGKALGLSLDRVDGLAKALDWWSDEAVPEEALRVAGLDPQDRTVQMVVRLVRQILGFPRHLSQHVGGFVITETPLCEIVPLENGAMPNRTFIEWDKNDIDALGILKVDCLALGMLTAMGKCFDMLQRHEGTKARRHAGSAEENLSSSCLRAFVPSCLTDVPAEDPAVYDMICAADTVGVFQIESRAQMSMLPRLKPRCFYDLVIEVAIVRPGPIQGGMVHPYLRRRDGLEPVWYPSPAVRGVLEKTLGVPLFQEQVMRVAVVAAGFTPGEADQLRRSMAAWGRGGRIENFQVRLIQGMLANGYPPAFAEQIFKQIRGFGEYGFPESHAASFALLVYVSAWLKRYHPAAFTGAILNSLPMGFYAPAQLVRDALRHGVVVLPVDVRRSGWECTLEEEGTEARRHEGTKGEEGTKARRYEGEERGDQDVSGSDCLAEEPCVGERGLPSHGADAGVGAVWIDEPDAPGSSIDPVKYSRGIRAAEQAGLHSFSAHSTRIAGRIGDATSTRGGLGVAACADIVGGDSRGDGSSAAGSDPQPGNAGSITPSCLRASVPSCLSNAPALRLGMRLIRGLSAAKVRGIEAAQRDGGITSIHVLARRPDVSRETLLRLAAADAFRSLGLNRRQALWQILALDDHPAPLFAETEPSEPPANLPVMPMDEVVVQDYDALGLSLNAHPIGLVRDELTALKVSPCARLLTARARQRIAVAGLVTHRQRPGTAKGLVFMTLEDETGTANLIIRPQVWDRDRRVGRGKVALIATGVVERVGAVIHVQVTRLSDLSAQIAPVRAKSRDFH